VVGDELPTSAEYVVIGSGIMGSSIAYHLAKSGAKNIVVLEKNTPASGPSGKSHAITPQYYTLEPLARMTSESWKFYLDFEKNIEGALPPFHRVGILYAYPAELEEKWKENLSYQKRFGMNPRIIDSSEIKEVAPEFFQEGFSAGVYEKDGGYVDPQVAVRGFVEAAVQMGVRFIQHTKAERLEIVEHRVVAVKTDRGTIRSPTVVSAAGIWTRPLLKEVGFDVPITNIRVGICMLKRPFRGDHLTFLDYINSVYIRSQGQSLTDIGIFEIHQEDYFDPTKSEDPDNYADSISDSDLPRYLEIGLRYPGLREASVQRTYACVYDNSPDRQPIMGKVPGIEGCWVAVGFSGHGFKMGPMVRRTMSELVLKDKS